MPRLSDDYDDDDPRLERYREGFERGDWRLKPGQKMPASKYLGIGKWRISQ